MCVHVCVYSCEHAYDKYTFRGGVVEQSRGCATNEISQDDIIKVGGTCRRVAFDLLSLFLLYHTLYVTIHDTYCKKFILNVSSPSLYLTVHVRLSTRI